MSLSLMIPKIVAHSACVTASSSNLAAPFATSILVLRGGNSRLGTYKDFDSSGFDSIYSEFHKLPEPFRYVVAAFIGSVAFFLIDRSMYKYLQSKQEILPDLLQKHLASTAYTMSYMIEIILQHWLNAFCWSGLETISTRKKYFTTLAETYSTYFLSIVLSVGLNMVLIQSGIHKDVAFVCTLAGLSIVNYVVLKWILIPDKTK